MADEDNIPGTGKHPHRSPMSRKRRPPAGFEQGVIPGIGDPPAPSDKVITLSEVREGAGGGDGAAIMDKNDPSPKLRHREKLLPSERPLLSSSSMRRLSTRGAWG